MVFNITNADMEGTSINKELWSRRAHIIKYLLIGGLLMQAISLVSETVSMGNFFNLYVQNEVYTKAGAFFLAFAMEFLIRGLVMYATIELYFAFQKQTDDNPDTNVQVIDVIIIVFSILSLLGLVYLSIFVSKRGTHDSFENAGLNRNEEKVESKELELESRHNSRITKVNSDYLASISPIKERYTQKIASKTKEFNAEIIKFRNDSLYYAGRTYKGKPFTRKCKELGKQIQSKEAEKEQAIQAIFGQQEKELLPFSTLKSQRVTSAETSYQESKDNLKINGDSDKRFLNIFSDIVSFIAGYSVLFFLTFQVLYVLILLRIGFKPNLALDKKYTRISFLDMLGEIWSMILTTLQQFVYDAFAVTMELFALILLPFRWIRKGLRRKLKDLKFVKFLHLSDEEDENKTNSSTTNSTTNSTAKATTTGTTTTNNSTTNGTTNGTTTTKGNTTNGTTNKTTKKEVASKKSVATRTTKVKGKDVVWIDSDIVVINNVVYGLWRDDPRNATFLRQQLVNNEGFLNRKESGRNMVTVRRNINRLNYLLKRINEVTKERVTTV